MAEVDEARFRRIATEEAFAVRAVTEAVHQWVGVGGPDEPDCECEDFLFNASGEWGEGLRERVVELDSQRLQITDDNGMRLELSFSEHIKRDFHITTSGMPWNPVLEFCMETVSADRISCAVDYPYEDTAEALRFLDAAPITDADKHKTYHQNAERLFGR